jgi:hypothetical protein
VGFLGSYTTFSTWSEDVCASVVGSSTSRRKRDPDGAGAGIASRLDAFEAAQGRDAKQV